MTLDIAPTIVDKPDKQDLRVLQLLERGRRQKYVSQVELVTAFPDAEANIDLFDHIYALLQDEGVEVILGGIKAAELEAQFEEAPSPEEMAQAFRELESSALEDPVRMYLREIGGVPLLSGAQEVAIAKRMEWGLSRDAEMEAMGLVPEERKLDPVVSDGVRARRQLIEANLRLVVSVAKRYISSRMSLLDLIQEGTASAAGD